MTNDEAKDFALETCKTAFQMDLHEIAASLNKWKFTIEDSEVLHDPGMPVLLTYRKMLPMYMVWLECECDFKLATRRLDAWFWELDRIYPRGFRWNGKWSFIVRFKAPANPPLTRLSCVKEFTFSVEKSWQIEGCINTLCGAHPQSIEPHGLRVSHFKNRFQKAA